MKNKRSPVDLKRKVYIWISLALLFFRNTIHTRRVVRAGGEGVDITLVRARTHARTLTHTHTHTHTIFTKFTFILCHNGLLTMRKFLTLAYFLVGFFQERHDIAHVCAHTRAKAFGSMINCKLPAQIKLLSKPFLYCIIACV